MNERDHPERRDRHALERALTEAGAERKGNAWRCPFHEDKNPSGDIYEDEGGIWRFKCHAASCGWLGDVFDVRAKVQNRPVADLLKESAPPQSGWNQRPQGFASLDDLCRAVPGTFEARYLYTHPDTGAQELIVVRYRDKEGKKKFWQAHWEGNRIIPKKPAGILPLYNRGRVRLSELIIVVEGEKCVHCLHELGFTATTSPGGAGKAGYADWSPLAGKTVVVWPDHDPGGLAHMDDVVAILSRLTDPPNVSRIDPAALDLGHKEDVCNYVQQCLAVGANPTQAIKGVIAHAAPVSVSSPLLQRIRDIHTGKWADIPWPWHLLSTLGRGLLPQNVCVFCGPSGGAKSFYMMSALLHWLYAGIRFAYLDLEEDRTYDLQRALAMLEGNGNLLDEDWMKQNPEEAEAAYTRQRKTLDILAPHIHEPPAQDVDTDWVCNWVKQQAEDGCRLVIVDPISVKSPAERPWIDDQKLITSLKTIMRTTAASIVLVSHPKKGAAGTTLDDLAGGAAYQRLAQAIFWLEAHGREGKDATVRSELGTTEMNIQHTIHICKTRKGRGRGVSLAFRADWELMSFTECGIILKKRSK